MGVTRTMEEGTSGQNTKPIFSGLQLIAEFLNTMGPRTTQAKWQAFLKSRRMRTGPRVSVEEAKELRRWITDDLGFLRSEQRLDWPFEELVYRLNELKLEMGWQCFPLLENAKPHDPSQAIFKIGGTKRWTARSWPITKTLRDDFYAILGKALESGMLCKLKVCRHCEKYLVVNDARREVCPGCKIEYQNRRRSTTGYWKDNRKDNRAKDIRSARKLIGDQQLTHTHASIEIVQKKTGLPRREVAKLFEEG